MPPPVRGIGHPTAFGVKDSTGVNPYGPNANWDVIFTPDLIRSNLPQIEVFHIALDGPVGSSAAVLIDNSPWDYVNQAWSNGWDPSQPMLLWQGASVQFCWNVAFTNPPYNKTSNIQPVVTLWMRAPMPQAMQPLPGLGVAPGVYGL